MSTVYVQFTDETESVVCSVFGNPQDTNDYPHQGEIDSSDERYQAFINPQSTPIGRWAAYQIEAQAELTASDRTILRCVENEVIVPSSWADYRKALRAIVGASSGDPTQPLPTRPAFPAGT